MQEISETAQQKTALPAQNNARTGDSQGTEKGKKFGIDKRLDTSHPPSRTKWKCREKEYKKNDPLLLT
jgi:hypothetical protein